MTALTPSHFGPFDDSEAFELPMPGLCADIEEGAAWVALPDYFWPAGRNTEREFCSNGAER